MYIHNPLQIPLQFPNNSDRTKNEDIP